MSYRFSLKAMFLATALIAVCCCGLLYANVIWAACFFTATFLIIAAATIAAFVRARPARIFWIGFAVLGGGYFLLATFADKIWDESRLATTHLLLWVDAHVGVLTQVPTENFLTVGHSIITILIAIAGGYFAQRISVRVSGPNGPVV